MAQLFKSPGIVADPTQFQSDVTFVADIIANAGAMLGEIATPAFVADYGFIYVKDVAGISELHYLDDAGNEIQITSGGAIPGVGNLDFIADGVTYGKVLLTSLTVGNEVDTLTDAAGDDLTVALGGGDRVLTITSASAINQAVLTSSSPTFVGATLSGLAVDGLVTSTVGVMGTVANSLDNINDGATHGKVLLTSLTGSEVTALTDAAGDDLTIALGGSSRVLTLGGNAALDQNLRQADTPLFSTLETTNEVILNEIATPANVANKGKAYAKDFAGASEFCYLDDAGNEVQITSGGAINVGTFSLDTILDGVTYGRVLLTSLTNNEVVVLTDAVGDDMTIALGGADRILTMSGDASLNQNLLTTSSPTFVGVTATGNIVGIAVTATGNIGGGSVSATGAMSCGTTMGVGTSAIIGTSATVGTDMTVGRDCAVARHLTSATLEVGGGYGSTGFSADIVGNIAADGDAWILGDVRPGGLDLNYEDSRLVYNVTDVNATPYNVVGGNDCYLQDRRTATGASTVNFPSIATVGDGHVLIVKDSGYNAATNNITCVPNGGDAINNVAGNYTMNVDGISLAFVANATTSDWEIN